MNLAFTELAALRAPSHVFERSGLDEEGDRKECEREQECGDKAGRKPTKAQAIKRKANAEERVDLKKIEGRYEVAEVFRKSDDVDRLHGRQDLKETLTTDYRLQTTDY